MSVNNENLFEVLRKGFPEDETAPCLLLPCGGMFTYSAMERETARIANLLVSLDVQPGDRVAVQVRKSPQALFLYLACLQAGAVYLPLNDAYQRHELEYFLTDATPRLFVCQPQMRILAGKLAEEAAIPHVLELDENGRGSLTEEASRQSPYFTAISRSRDDLAAIVYTSGTTGRSKGAMLTHGNLAANARVLHSYWQFRPGDVLLHMLPIYHVHGLFIAIHCALLNGSPMLFEPRFDAQRAMELLPRATVFMAVPTYYVRLVAEQEFGRGMCTQMRLFISGSAPLLPETFIEFRKRTGHTILERYGMTEGGMFSSNPYDGERRTGTVGFPLPGTDIRLVGDAGQSVRCGEVGAIQVRGDNVFAGYWQMHDKTREEFTDDGYFKTGDLGIWDRDGYLSIIGRSKDLVITGGLNVYPREIEELIDALPGVVESAVIGLPDTDFGEIVAAVVVRRPDDAGVALTAAGIVEAVKGEVAGFKVPKRVIFVNELPRNAMGKVQKNLLRQQCG